MIKTGRKQQLGASRKSKSSFKEFKSSRIINDENAIQPGVDMAQSYIRQTMNALSQLILNTTDIQHSISYALVKDEANQLTTKLQQKPKTRRKMEAPPPQSNYVKPLDLEYYIEELADEDDIPYSIYCKLDVSHQYEFCDSRLQLPQPFEGSSVKKEKNRNPFFFSLRNTNDNESQPQPYIPQPTQPTQPAQLQPIQQTQNTYPSPQPFLPSSPSFTNNFQQSQLTSITQQSQLQQYPALSYLLQQTKSKSPTPKRPAKQVLCDLSNLY